MSGGDDRSILLWNPYNGKLVNRYRGHNYEVLSIDVTQDSSKMASCGGDKQPLLWDVTTGNVLRRFRGHDNVTNTKVSLIFSHIFSFLFTHKES